MSTPVPVRALALALMASPLAISAFAGAVLPNGVSPASDIVQLAAKKSRNSARQQHSAPGTCTGIYMYWSTKERRCMDARDKPMARPPGVSPEEPWFPGSKGGEPACMRGKAGC